MKRLKPISILCSLLLLQTTTVYSQSVSVVRQPMSRASKLSTIEGLPARGGKVDWGLAISGGGIRSGSYSVGVMKALYDVGFLNDVDAISTVSGGGFAAYWLFGRQLELGGDQFGSIPLANDTFLSSVKGLTSKSDMFSLWKMFTSVFKSRSGAAKTWGKSIHKTFGQNSLKLGSTKLGTFSPGAESTKLPLLIVNTTLLDPTSKAKKPINESEDIVEITPDHIGGVSIGISSWSSADSSPFYGDVVATSSAGKPKIRRSYPNFAAADNDSFGQKRTLDLYDGGCSENLGAMSLIRRGLKNVVIIDAEHDPKYLYVSYVKLRESLDRINIDLKIKEIDEVAISVTELPRACPESWFTKAKRPNSPPKHSVMIGTARNRDTGEVTNVFYIKMSRTSELFPTELETRKWKGVDTEERDAILKDHFCRSDASCSDYCIGRAMVMSSSDNNTNSIGSVAACSSDKDVNRKFEQRFTYLTFRYGYYVKAQRRLNIMKGFGDFWTYDFPHTTTSDQSLYSDQMEAFIGLGYLQGKRLAGHLEPKLQ